MRKMLALCIAVLLLGSKCNDCDDCGDASGNESHYSFINLISREVSLCFFGEDKILNINLMPNDTSISWSRITVPPPGGSYDLFFTRNNDSFNGFPFNSDSLQIILEKKVLKTYIRENFAGEVDWESSIYLDQSPPYHIKTIMGIGYYYYPLDSANLNLK